MITNVSIVSVWVKDIDESLAFYTDVLGFVRRRRRPARGGLPVVHGRPPQPARAQAAPHHAEQAALRRPHRRDDPRPGRGRAARRRPQRRRLPQDLRGPRRQGRGVPPGAEERPYGVEALLRDNSGNWMVLVEPRDYSPEDFEGTDSADPGSPAGRATRGIVRHADGGGHAQPARGDPGREVVALGRPDPAGEARRDPGTDHVGGEHPAEHDAGAFERRSAGDTAPPSAARSRPSRGRRTR